MNTSEKLETIYKLMPKANFKIANSVSRKDQLESKEWLRMIVGDIDSTIECDGWNEKLQSELDKYANILFLKLN